MPDVPLHGGMFLGCVLESFGYGLLTVMVIFTVRSLIANQQTRYPSPLLLTVLALVWILSTGHWISNVYRAYQAFIVNPDGPIAFYATLNLPSYTARNILYVTLVIVCDSFAVYRVFRVWNKNWYIIILPIIMIGGSAVAGYGTTYYFAIGKPGAVFNTPIIPWGTSWYAMNVATNAICTCLIGYKIVRSQMAVRGLSTASGARLWNTLTIIVESAAIYTAALVVVLTTTVVGVNSAFTALDIAVSTVGITFTLIILRVSLGVSSDYYGGSTTEGTRYPGTRSGDVAVNVSRLVEYSGNTSYSGMAGGKTTFTDDIKLNRVDHDQV